MKTIIVCLCLSLSSCISYHIVEKDVFYPRSIARLDQRLALEDVYLTTSDSIHLNAWFVKHPHAEGTMLYFGGNGFSLWNRVTSDVINTLSGFNMNVLLIDYRENDTVTPPEMGKKLSEAAPSANKRYVVIAKGEHSDLFFTNDGRRERYLQVVSEFVTSVTRRQ
jgi:hypothetical protein